MGYTYSQTSTKRPVFAHNKAWQRIEDSLVEMTTERMSTILDEPISVKRIGRHKLYLMQRLTTLMKLP